MSHQCHRDTSCHINATVTHHVTSMPPWHINATVTHHVTSMPPWHIMSHQCHRDTSCHIDAAVTGKVWCNDCKYCFQKSRVTVRLNSIMQREKNVWLKKASCKGVVCSLFLTYLPVAHINELTHLPPGQKSFHFADIFKCISMNEKSCISILISLNLFERVQLTVSQQWFRQWLGGEQATSHYLNRCCPVHWHIYTALGEMS